MLVNIRAPIMIVNIRVPAICFLEERLVLFTGNFNICNQFCGSGSGIRCLFDFFYPSWIRDEHPGSYFRELRNNFFGLKHLNSLMRIRDPGWKTFESGINIPDPQHCLYPMDWHRFDALPDPDPTFHFKADPDPDRQALDADLNPVPAK
jgi:hypothetical protein